MHVSIMHILFNKTTFFLYRNLIFIEDNVYRVNAINIEEAVNYHRSSTPVVVKVKGGEIIEL